jgi:hypothetical protein
MGIGILIGVMTLAGMALGGLLFREGYRAGARTVWKIRGGEGDPTKIEPSAPLTETDTS